MTGLLDTSVLVGLEQARLDTSSLPLSGAVSVVTLEELWLGVRQAHPEVAHVRQATYEIAVRGLEVLEVDLAVARASGDIRAEGRARGRRYGLADSLIGATARAHGLPLYTQDEGMQGMVGVDVRLV